MNNIILFCLIIYLGVFSIHVIQVGMPLSPAFSTRIQRTQIWSLTVLQHADHHECFMAGNMARARPIKAFPAFFRLKCQQQDPSPSELKGKQAWILEALLATKWGTST